MKLWKSWAIARKDLKILRRRKSLVTLLMALPLGLAILLSVAINEVILRRGFSTAVESNLIGAFGFFFLILAGMLPLYISSYSMVGEKLEYSLEPLLSTPTTDGEILMGKYIGTMIPAIISLYVADVVYMVLIDIITGSKFGYLFYPNWGFGIIMLIATPIASTYAITLSVFISSKVNSVVAAYQTGGVTLIPFLVMYVLGEVGIVNLNDSVDILIISGALLLAAVVTFFVSRQTFGREKVLTQWK